MAHRAIFRVKLQRGRCTGKQFNDTFGGRYGSRNILELRAERGWRVVNDSPLALLTVLPPPGAADARTVVARVLRSGSAWVSLAHFEEQDVIRICVTHGETSDADLTLLLQALESSAVP